MSSVISKLVLTAVVLTVGAGSAFAADDAMKADKRESVRDRARPAYDAVGIKAGAFTVYPKAGIKESYDDNIYATDTNETDDFITELSADVYVTSNWSRHLLNFSAGVKQALYADYSDENRLDWNLGVDGRLDITRDTQLSGSLSYAELHEDRGDPNATFVATEPTPYSLLGAEASFAHRFNRLGLRLSGSLDDYDYDDVYNSVGLVIDQDDRDRTEYGQALRASYEVTPDTNLYVEGSLNQRDYDLTTPAVAFNRNSDGYAVVGGSEFRLSNLAQGSIYAGYQAQSYEDPALGDVTGLRYGANVEWYATPLTTVTFNAGSTIEETTTAGASGYLAQSVGARIDHELLRNILVNGSLSFENDDYEGVSRSDDVVRAGLGAEYLLNRNFSVSLDYDYTDRSSSAPGNDYSRNVIGLTLSGQL